jgi:hypothetical protein
VFSLARDEYFWADTGWNLPIHNKGAGRKPMDVAETGRFRALARLVHEGEMRRFVMEEDTLAGWWRKTMKRNIWLATLALAVGVLGPMPLAKSSSQKQEHPKAQPGTQLVAWTQDRKAEPMPSTQTTPPAQQQPDTQTPGTPAKAQQDDTKHRAARAFTGTIIKSGDVYVLQTSDNMTYQLDDQERARQYEGKQVQVTGSLDKNNDTIKVRDIKQAA